MLLIRPATVEDEKVYRRHWEDEECEYQWLWHSKVSSKETAEVVENEWTELIEEIYSREREITFSSFTKTLQRDRIFIIELDGKTIGSIRFLDYCKGDWRIADWAMELDDDNLKKDIIKKFASLKLPRAKQISICTIDKPIIEFLLSNGFEERALYFYYLPLKKRSG